jgi:hypothetical protein
VPSTQTSPLPRTGLFIYPPGCTASVGDYEFYDTSIDVLETEIIRPDILLSFYDLARDRFPAWPIDSIPDTIESAARDTNVTESIIAIGMRARLARAYNIIGKMGRDNEDIQLFKQQIAAVVGGILLTIAVTAVNCVWNLCRQKCHRGRADTGPDEDPEPSYGTRSMLDTKPLQDSSWSLDQDQNSLSPEGTASLPRMGILRNAETNSSAPPPSRSVLSSLLNMEQHNEHLNAFMQNNARAHINPKSLSAAFSQ